MEGEAFKGAHWRDKRENSGKNFYLQSKGNPWTVLAFGRARLLSNIVRYFLKEREEEAS